MPKVWDFLFFFSRTKHQCFDQTHPKTAPGSFPPANFIRIYLSLYPNNFTHTYGKAHLIPAPMRACERASERSLVCIWMCVSVSVRWKTENTNSTLNLFGCAVQSHRHVQLWPYRIVYAEAFTKIHKFIFESVSNMFNFNQFSPKRSSERMSEERDRRCSHWAFVSLCVYVIDPDDIHLLLLLLVLPLLFIIVSFFFFSFHFLSTLVANYNFTSRLSGQANLLLFS